MGKIYAISTDMKSASDNTLASIPVRIAKYSDPLEMIVSLELVPAPWEIVKSPY